MPQTSEGRAFGLDIDADFSCPGLQARPVDAEPRPPVSMRLASRRELLAAFPRNAERFWAARTPAGRVSASFWVDPEAGYLMRADGYGCFLISKDGDAVRCAPVRAATWRWQRYLVGQVLPFAATLRGLEVFHASVVAIENQGAVVFLGWSRAGKSSIAAALLLGGGRLLADDVMAVDTIGDDTSPVDAQPGWGLMSVRHDAVGRLGADAVARLGRPIGADDDAHRVEVELAGARPIIALYVLERGDAGSRSLIEDIVPSDPRLLLASTYNFLIRTPTRLVRQLDVCARLSKTARLARLTVSPETGPLAAAEAVRSHASRLAVLP